MFTPGADGAMAMAAARAGARRPVLVIDQFEEAFTLRGATFARLAGRARPVRRRSRPPVVLAVRSDHVAELGADAELARLAERGLHLVTPCPATGSARPRGPGPCRRARWSRTGRPVVRDADDSPAPSRCCRTPWPRPGSDARRGLLTVDGYRAAGGISGAVAASAERLYEGLSADERGELRWLMLRLVRSPTAASPSGPRCPRPWWRR